MANVVKFQSTQQNAPVLSGQNNSLVALLDACLVNGYPTISVASITQSGNVATVTASAAHGLSTGDRVTIAGAAQTDYNISAYVTVTSATVFTYTVANNPTSPATGTITMNRAGAGWTKPFSATNKAVYRMNPTNNTGFYLNVQDNGPGAGAAKEARVWGYEVATAQDTGTGQFSTTGQQTNGLFIRKSTTADATARPWYIVADDSCFYLFIESGDYTLPTRATAFAFGDFFSYKASDAYRCMIIGRDTENSGSYSYERFPQLAVSLGTQITALTTAGHYIARSTTGAGGSVAFGVHGDLTATGFGSNPSSAPNMMGQSNNNGAVGALGLSYPNPADNGLYMAPAYIHHNGGMRGYLKGLWTPSHDLPLGHGDTFTGTGALSAKSFLVLQMSSYTPGMGAECFLETSNTWS